MRLIEPQFQQFSPAILSEAGGKCCNALPGPFGLPRPRMAALLVFALVAFACMGTWLLAQDVTVTPPVLFDLPNFPEQPDTPPTPRGKWKPEFPPEMRKTAEPGYVVLTQFTTEKGDYENWGMDGSNAYYKQSIRQDIYSPPRYNPALKNGRPAGGFSWFVVIFNPASASEKKPDATPRLLKVAPIFVTLKQLAVFPKDTKVVRGTIEIDTAGMAKNLTFAPGESHGETVRPLIERSLTQWQFAPARKNGKPVDATLTLSLVLQIRPAFKARFKNDSDDSTFPELIERTPPDYPNSLLFKNMVGEVELEFTVGIDGNVHSPKIIRSNNPALEKPVLDAIVKWKYKPATKGGKPVEHVLRVPMIFSLPDARNPQEGYSAAPPPSKKQIAQMPEDLRYDVAPKPRGVIYPVYPYAQFRDGKKGKASVAVLVSSHGNVTEMAVTKETAPEFGQAALAACEHLEFIPGLLEGRPTDAVLRVDLEFDSDSPFIADKARNNATKIGRQLSFHEGNAAPSADDYDMLRLEKKSPEKIIRAQKLDSMPKLIVQREPRFPLVARQAGLAEGKTVVEFLIDIEGNVRLPRIVSSTHPSFGYMAVQTVATWRYEPPTAQGKPVVTRIRVPFEFTFTTKGQPKTNHET